MDTVILWEMACFYISSDSWINLITFEAGFLLSFDLQVICHPSKKRGRKWRNLDGYCSPSLPLCCRCWGKTSVISCLRPLPQKSISLLCHLSHSFPHAPFFWPAFPTTVAPPSPFAPLLLTSDTERWIGDKMLLFRTGLWVWMLHFGTSWQLLSLVEVTSSIIKSFFYCFSHW